MKKEVQKKHSSLLQEKKKESFFHRIKNMHKKKKLLLGLILITILAVISVSVFFIVTRDEDDTDDSIFYYPAYESENIFENDAYMSFERSLRYSYGGVEQLYRYDSDYNSADAYCKFFLDYFKALTEGNGEALFDLHVDGYFDSVPQFTMQMIYEPFVFFHSEGSVEENGEKLNVANFEVRYKIFKNNGSFRQGVHSNQAVPQIYQLIIQNGEIKIKNILNIEYSNAN